MLRILPALAVVLIVSAFVIGPLLTTVSPSAYFFHKAPLSPFSYVAWNLVFRTQYALPGVFAANPYSGVVNGSLWSLAPEVECYAGVAILGVAGVIANRWAMLALALCFSGLGAAFPHVHHEFFVLAAVFSAVQCSCRCSTSPSIGGWHWAQRRSALLTLCLGGFLVAAPWALTYLVHYVCRSPSVRLPRLPIDPSYGIYIWAFPVQQIVKQHLRGPETLVLSVAIALPITLGLGAAFQRTD